MNSTYNKRFICSVQFDSLNYSGSILTINNEEVKIWHILKRASYKIDDIKMIQKYNRWFNSIVIIFKNKTHHKSIYIHNLRKKSILKAFKEIGLQIEYHKD